MWRLGGGGGGKVSHGMIFAVRFLVWNVHSTVLLIAGYVNNLMTFIISS